MRLVHGAARVARRNLRSAGRHGCIDSGGRPGTTHLKENGFGNCGAGFGNYSAGFGNHWIRKLAGFGNWWIWKLPGFGNLGWETGTLDLGTDFRERSHLRIGLTVMGAVLCMTQVVGIQTPMRH